MKKSTLILFAIISVFILTNCIRCESNHIKFFIKNNTKDTLFVIFHHNKKILDYSNCSFFDERFGQLIPNDSLDEGWADFCWEKDYFLIIVDDDTLSKYATFEDVVRLKKYKEIYFSQDSLNNMKCIVISEEMIK